jgi:hypothetical protein
VDPIPQRLSEEKEILHNPVNPVGQFFSVKKFYILKFFSTSHQSNCYRLGFCLISCANRIFSILQ